MNILQNNEQFFANTINSIPANLDAEEAILGGLLLDPQAIFQVADKLAPEVFYATIHQDIYKACLTLYKRKQVCDLMAVTDYLTTKKQLEKVGGALKLIQLLNSTVSTVNIDRHVDLIVEKWLRRRVIELGYKMVSEASDGTRDTRAILEDLYEKSANLNSVIGSEKTGDMETWTLSQIIKEFRAIEMTVLEPALKSFKLYRLAKKYGMDRKGLESIFYQYLIGKDNETYQYIKQLREECGDKVNEWFMHGFIPKGTVILLHALGGIGKSRLSYEFTYHLASGTPWGNFHVTAPRRKVALIQTDESKHDAMRAIEDRWEPGEIDNYVCLKSKWSMEHIARLRHEIEAHGIEVIIIDSLTSVNKHNLFSENETEYARPILLLKEIAEELGCTFLIVHHSNSEGKSRGTKAIFNSVSLVLSLQLPSEGSDRGTPNRLLCIEKSRFQTPTKYRLRYEIDEETHQWQWVCDSEATGGDESDRTVKEKILQYLDLHRNISWEAKEISDRIGNSYGEVRRSCYQLANNGLIGRKRSQRDIRAWGYFLAWDDGSPNILDPIVLNNDRITIGSNDRIQNVVSESNTVRSDHPIVKNALKNDQKIAQKNEQINDRMITSKRSHPETTINQEFQQSDRSDRRSDRRNDRDAIESDRIESDRIESDRTYKYVGNDRQLDHVCRGHSDLRILEVQDKKAIVTAPKWVVKHKIPLKDLKPGGDR